MISRSLARRFLSDAPPLTRARNAIGIQMLPPNLQKQIFPDNASTVADAKLTNQTLLDIAQRHLQKQNLWGRPTTTQPDVELECPPLLGLNIKDHFQNMAHITHCGYLDLAKNFCRVDVPLLPAEDRWIINKPGWTRYDSATGAFSFVPHPLEHSLVFDVEVLAKFTKYPIMATAASDKAWYSWLSPVIFDDAAPTTDNYRHLIPLGKVDTDRLVIGHHVSYDRARIAEEYDISQGRTRFLDTMSMHVAVCGLSSNQRSQWIKIDKEVNDDSLCGEFDITKEDMEWYSQSALNSLKNVALFHLGKVVDKSARDVFVEGDLTQVRQQLRTLLTYCANDVLITHQVFQKVFPKFMGRKVAGNRVTFAGVLEMGQSYLPVSKDWPKYIETCDTMVNERQQQIQEKLLQIANEYLQRPVEERETDVFMKQLCWLPATKKNPIPKWYRQLIPSKQSEPVISIRSRVAPLLLGLTWLDYPLFFLGKSFGWCYRVPRADMVKFSKMKALSMAEMERNIQEARANSKTVKESSEEQYLQLMCNDYQDFVFFRLPSPQNGSDEDANCGSPFSKSFLHAFTEGKLTSSHAIAKQAIEYNVSCSYWISARDRVRNQFVVGLGEQGVILPPIVTMGTVTRRAVEPTWLTASNAKAGRIGSELKCMVQAPKGYSFVGADVDSQELWIASLLGDAQFGIQGATAFGWMTLQGNKADGTDLHSRSAAILGASRDQAKIFNYARIYGSGLKFAAALLSRCDPSIAPEDAMIRAKALFVSTKGTRKFDNRAGGKKSYWKGGSESYMFNKLEEIALSDDPRTPVLGCQLPDSLMPAGARKKYITSCINWVVQSSGVDYLHLLLSSMAYLSKVYDIKCRLLVTIHDEIRFLVRDEDAKRAALALQISNLWTRSLFAHQLGMKELPLSVAFFSSVDIDKVLRKEVYDLCKTPSLPAGINVKGEGLSIYQLLDVSLGQPKDTPAVPLLPPSLESLLLQSNKISDPKWLQTQL